MDTNDFLLPPPTSDEDAYTPATLRDELLGKQRRDRVALRVDLCQQHGGDRAPGPLRLFVGKRRLFALQLYLLLACLASSDPWDKEMAASSWALMLDDGSGGAESKVSRNWSWMKDEGLVRTETKGRNLIVYRMHEAGDEEYTPPTRKERFFYLPFAYFMDEWHTKLSLSATAALLIALSKSTRQNWFELPLVRAPQWYGISTDTLQRGFDELQGHGLLRVHQRRKRHHRARGGSVQINEYALLGAFMTHVDEDAEEE